MFKGVFILSMIFYQLLVQVDGIYSNISAYKRQLVNALMVRLVGDWVLQWKIGDMVKLAGRWL